MSFRSIVGATSTSVVVALALASPAAAEPDYASARSADIRPGSMTSTQGGGQCTSNFVYEDGEDVYLGQAAHCAGTDGNTATNGCETGSEPLGTPVRIEGADHRGTLAYSSWLTMQAEDEDDDNTCEFNDFALVKLHPDDVEKVNPSVPFFGGPTGIADSTDLGDDVYSYGDSSLRQGLEALSPKFGKSLGQSGGGWNHEVYTLTPGIPGDSGSGFLDKDGKAFGTLTTVQLAPKPASNGVTDLSRALDYLKDKSDLDVELAEGTEDFRALPVPSDLLDQSLPTDAEESDEEEGSDDDDNEDEGDDDDGGGIDDIEDLVEDTLDDVEDLLDL